MADIANVSGVRSGTQAFTQAYLSRAVISTLASILPIIYFTLAMDGNKKGMQGIGNPNVGTLVSRVPTARAREKQIYGAEMYQPLIHNQLPNSGDGRSVAMRDVMPTVGSGAGTGVIFGTPTLSGNAITVLPVIYGGAGYTASTTITMLGGIPSSGSITAPVLTPVITAGVITSITVTSGGANIGTAGAFFAGSAGTSSDQHFERPFVKWVEFVDPILVYKKPMRRLKNQLKGASSAEREAAIGSLISVATDEARVVHLTRWAKEFWGITTTSDVGPTSQSAEVWDHMLSLPSACHTTNLYAGLDRSLTSNAFWLGNRTTAHRAANLESLFNEANYTNGCADIGLGVKVLFCGPTLFPQFVSQALGRGGNVIYNGQLPEMGQFGLKRPILQFNDMFVVYDPFCPDKARIDPRTGTNYTKNACFAANLDTFTFAFEPEAKFSVDKPFDLTQIDGGKDAWKSQMRTEMLGVCEAPKGNQYWEDVG